MSGLSAKYRLRLLAERPRHRIAIGWLVLPREEDHAPVQRPLLILRGFQRGLDQAPQMALPTAPPCRLDDGQSVADR